MALLCEDLAAYGVVLISERGVDDSAVLVNRASQPIASLAYIWIVHSENRVSPRCFTPGTNVSALLPFPRMGTTWKPDIFANTIFPGSKRAMQSNGSRVGDNTDVRPPNPDGVWGGPAFGVGVGFSGDDADPLKLTLDGVFFLDGGFAGANLLGAWEATIFSAEAHLACANLARTAQHKFFDEVSRLTGQADTDAPPPPPRFLGPNDADPEPIRRSEWQDVGWKVFQMRRTLGDAEAVATVAAWANARVPKFHKL